MPTPPSTTPLIAEKLRIRDIFKDPERNDVYIIAEIGINHNGDIATALTLIDAAAAAGVDAVKFQKRDLDQIYTKALLDNPNSQEWSLAYLLPQLKILELSENDYQRIRKKCADLGLELIITPFDERSADFVAKLDVAAFKIASADLVNYPLVTKCSGFGKPLIMSTGMWTQAEIFTCVNWYEKNLPSKEFALLLANSTYPSSYGDLGLPLIPWLANLHTARVTGYSGHEPGIFIPIAAVAYGARIVEKHITLDPLQQGPDHKASLTPKEFKEMVANIRDLQKAMAKEKTVSQSERLAKEVFAKSTIAVKDLAAGTKLSAHDFQFKSPGKGLFPHEVADYLGSELKRFVPKDGYISKFDFQEEMKIKDWTIPAFSRDWGVKCRFHDYDEYMQCRPKVIEFHTTQEDFAIDFKGASADTQLIIHAPEFSAKQLIDLCSSDPAVAALSVNVLQKTIDYTLDLAKRFPKKKPKIVAHLGGMSQSLLENPFAEMLSRAVDNFKKLRFNASDVDFLPECLPSNPAYFGGYWHQYGFMRAEDMTAFCQQFGLKMCFDTSHAAMYCNDYGKELTDYTRTIKPYISHLHISDAKGSHSEGLQIGEGAVAFADIFTLLKDITFTWVPEPWSGHLYKGQGFYTSLRKLGQWAEML